ncbi:MAG: twin-arginine translocation signal domain-containing protein, partial [Methylobacteriaceae bacterium]|nr:twin-arginine translocation signal domain-containing protein [Methylobacteriaceae bacterium]
MISRRHALGTMAAAGALAASGQVARAQNAPVPEL